MISEMFLKALSRTHADPDVGMKDDQSAPLALLEREYPDLAQLVTEKGVLDFGCGTGAQAGALAMKYGARVVGLDTNPRWIAAATERYGRFAIYTSTPEEASYDVVISQNAMEHFSDPAQALAQMRAMTKIGGLILITFGPPWYAPFGHHMHYFCRIPWLNLIFPERAVMAVRSRYKDDGARRYTEVEGGLNKMSIAKFERLVRECGLELVHCRYRAVKELQVLARIPMLRELFINHVTVILRRR